MALKKAGEGETPRQYFYRIYEAKKNGEAWAKKIPCDAVVYYADQGDIKKVRLLLGEESN